MRGFFSGIGRSGLVELVSGAVGSKSIVSLVQGFLIDKIVVSSRCGRSIVKAPRKNGLSPLLDGVVLGRLSRRLRTEKLGFIQCTSSYLVLIGDRGTTGQIVGDVAGCLRRALNLGIGIAGDGIRQPDKVGFLKFNFF